MKPSPGSKNPCNKGAGYQNQFLVTKILEAPFDKPTDLLHTSSISKQSTALSIPIEAPAGSDSAMKKFKPKFSTLELKSNPPQYAKVRITKVFSPKAVYVQIKDGNFPRYQKMRKDLQLEFRGSTSQSASYCKSPILGSYISHQLRFECVNNYLLANILLEIWRSRLRLSKRHSVASSSNPNIEEGCWFNESGLHWHRPLNRYQTPYDVPQVTWPVKCYYDINLYCSYSLYNY